MLCLLLPSVVLALSSQPKIPITILSGFLGAGKTTLLQNLLENKQGLKIAVVVNDVASVNIDSALVKDSTTTTQGGKSDGMVELQNGCACCSLADELMTSVAQLVTMSDMKSDEDQFQHIVIELSGVADPKSVRSKFQEAVLDEMTVMERVQLDTLVTLVDATMFKKHFESAQIASRKETPELFYREGEEVPPEKEPWMDDLPPKLLEALMVGMQGADEQNAVCDLLVSQTETADLVVLSKVDLVEDEQELQQLEDIVGALNPRGTILRSAHGKLPIESVLGVAKAKGVVNSGVVDDHRDFVQVATKTNKKDSSIEVQEASSGEACTDPDCTDPSHSHSHSHDHDDCKDPDCTDTSHSHSHDHQADAECTDPGCTDTSHSHSHSHVEDECKDPECTDTSHSHSHSHAETECSDPDCTDTSHSHTHSHGHAHSHTGIGTFVYQARRPFHPGRLVSFLTNLPVVRGVPEGSEDKDSMVVVSEDTKKALKDCLRSKGFVWTADSHNSAMYWSHAGSAFELSCLGQWWATLPRDQWPEDAHDYAIQDFDDPAHDDVNRPKDTVGDRRQEVVFIGQKYSDPERKQLICDTLDQCLLQDKEYDEYKEMQYGSEESLKARFANVIESKYVRY